ncbi:hypothetical protein [Azospirillum doebereinerae]|uniref:Uncharacterized protein n=1 Tax=Azospirillum doebereinerae TaxID=92933 RepID=A0A433J882_9PROT|nr:hypothetical protein [Azospirillum doebereinerae]MCG5241743.1 hypothetical protein [Azospirillum doebereinerae]RUQ70174.1 hypothetical protein EJ913_14325 [Azospirillum doebereinerae]
MSAPMIADEVRTASRIHARLLDGFIAMTEQELARLAPGFAEESLLESLERLRAARKSYGTTAGVVVATVTEPVLAASNAA